jgi:hypothetical protein
MQIRSAQAKERMQSHLWPAGKRSAQKMKFAFLQGTGYRACGIVKTMWCTAWRFALLLQ